MRWVPAAGVTTDPDGDFMAQVARNLTADDDGFLRDMRFLILDRDSKLTDHFCEILKDAGVRIVRTASQAPDMHGVRRRDSC